MKLIVAILLTIFGAALSGCPNIVVNQMEEMERINDSLKNYRPQYLRQPYSYNDYKELANRRHSIDSLSTDCTNSDTARINITTGIDSTKSINITTSIDSTSRNNRSNDVAQFVPDIKVINVNSDAYPDSVIIDVIVADTTSKYILGLAPPYLKEDFKKYWISLIDSCADTNQSIQNYYVTEIRQNSSPDYSIAFILDYSSSMGKDKIAKLKNGVIDLIQYMKEPDMVAVITFEGTARVDVPLERNKFKVLDKFKADSANKTRREGGTAFYDAIATGLKELDNSPNNYQKIIIAFTDGGDNRSRLKYEELFDTIKYVGGVRLFTIGYGDANAKVLDPLANVTSGKFYMTYSSKEFPYVFRDIYLRLTNFYRISFVPFNCGGKHYAVPTLSLPEITDKELRDTAIYKAPLFENNIEIGNIVFLNIEYESGSYEIKDQESLEIIDEAYKWLKKNPNINIMIKGHTDDIGSADYNLELSNKRAKSVGKRLIDKGIDRNRISTMGFGESVPLAPNTNAGNRRINRRTEIEIVK